MGWKTGWLILVLAALVSDAGVAAEPYSYSVGLLAGVGGPIDSDPDIGLDHSLLQLNLGFVSRPRTHVVARLGQLGLDDPRGLEGLDDAELTYLTLGGEYRYLESLYDSGIFLALGGYRLEGTELGSGRDETAIGLSFGVTGDFRINQNWSVAAELVGHWADFDRLQTFATGQIGIAYHF